MTQIVTADRGYERFPGIERLDPADVDAREALITTAPER